MSVLHERLRRMQGRLAVGGWEYRQRAHAKGAWFRLRRLLADAERAFVVDAADAAALDRQGLRPEPAGLELHPPRHLYFVSAGLLAQLGSAHEIPVRIDAQLLGAPHVVLLRFP